MGKRFKNLDELWDSDVVLSGRPQNALNAYKTFDEFMDAVESRAEEAKVLDRMREALQQDLAPLGEALWQAYQQSDPERMRAALKTISETLPDLAGDSEALATAMAQQFTNDFLLK